jgi:hypothetical protein
VYEKIQNHGFSLLEKTVMKSRVPVLYYCYRNMYIFRYDKYVFITFNDEFLPL